MKQSGESFQVQCAPPDYVQCPDCKRLDSEANHPVGMIFVGWGLGWQPCLRCDGSGRIDRRKDSGT